MNKVSFLDPDFPPTESSLYAKDKSNEPVHDGKPVTWRRPCDFMGGSFDVFQGGIEPNDIRQGSLADCWFLCALSSLAEFPQLVMNLFEEKSKTPRARSGLGPAHHRLAQQVPRRCPQGGAPRARIRERPEA